MTRPISPGSRFRAALREEKPLQVVGAINAYAARLAERTGFKALYVSGGGVAAGSLGVPDLGISTMEDVLTDVRRITDNSELPVLVDIDTGWGGAFNIARTIKSMIKSGAAAVHIEDQVQSKRCGHRPGKAIVSKDEMVDRIKAAVDAKIDSEFVIMARTDALAVEGLEAAIERAPACVAAGADMIFPEAMTDLAMYKKFAQAVKVPILANITEFGSTPFYYGGRTAQRRCLPGTLSAVGIPRHEQGRAFGLSAIRREETQKNVIDLMQTRADLYDYLDYHAFEEKLDKIFSKEEKYMSNDTITATTAAAPKVKKSVALSGVVAGNSAVCTVGRTGNDLHYRGYDIVELAKQSTFEEVAYLLVHGELPTQSALKDYKKKLKGLRGLPAQVKTVLEHIPASAHPMDVLRTGCSILGNVLPEKDDQNIPGAGDIIDRLVASFGSMLLYWWHFSQNGTRIDVETDDDTVAGHFLHLLHGKKPTALHEKALDQSLILYAEHEFTASTFTARVISRHAFRCLFGHHRGDRSFAGTEARRRERSGP